MIQGYLGDGGFANQARLHFPVGVGMDDQGNLYIADRNNNCVRKVDTNSIITTVTGNGEQDYGGDGGPALKASLKWPRDVVVNPAGTLYILDTLQW